MSWDKQLAPSNPINHSDEFTGPGDGPVFCGPTGGPPLAVVEETAFEAGTDPPVTLGVAIMIIYCLMCIYKIIKC